MALGCLGRGRFATWWDDLACQEVVDVANGHPLAVLFVLFLELLDPHDIVIFLPDQILHVELAEAAAIRLLLLLEKLEGALQLLLAMGAGLHLLFLQLVGRAGALQLKLLQLQEALFFSNSVEEAVGLLPLRLNLGDVVPIDRLAALFEVLQALLGLLHRLLRLARVECPLLRQQLRLLFRH